MSSSPAPSPRYVLASGNTGKLAEIQAILAPLGIDLVPQSELGIGSVPETGDTFTENALIKARHACREAGLPAIADDSGLEVEALGGRPGIYSARFAGPDATDRDNLEKLLAALAGTGEDERTARFTCVIALVEHPDDPAPVLCTGHWTGRIATAPAGDGGFGYDPVFRPDGMDGTAAELPAKTKNRLSHRAAALAELRAAIRPQPHTPAHATG